MPPKTHSRTKSVHKFMEPMESIAKETCSFCCQAIHKLNTTCFSAAVPGKGGYTITVLWSVLLQIPLYIHSREVTKQMIDELRSSSIQTVPHQDTCVCMFTMPMGWNNVVEQ